VTTVHDRIPILYIGGWGRSGSTLLDRMLGQLPGILSLGEVREIWQSGCVENRPCGCGRPFRACPFWREVGERAFGGWERVDLPEALREWGAYDRPWALPLLLGPRRRRRAHPGLREYASLFERIYRAVLAVSEASLLVDSSKLTTHALILATLPSVDLRFVHLVRDSRGAAYSWGKTVRDHASTDRPLYMERYGPAASAARWLLYNEPARMTRARVPSLLMRYEDLIADPRGQLDRILDLAGWPDVDRDFSFLEGRRVHLEMAHTVDGNPIRFDVGDLELKGTDEWRDKMGKADQLRVTALTFPRLRSYGYPVRVGGDRH
jgi:hypothetical protein